MTNYVLVHGAWGGGWAYDRTAADLRAAGHCVLVAQLAGLGTRAADLNSAIDLSQHIADVCQQIDGTGFEHFVLAGHSYGGMVITGVATQMGTAIDAIVYIDAFLPADGQSLWDITGDWEHTQYIDGQKDEPGLVRPLPGMERVPRIGRHPLLTLLEPVHFTGEEARPPRRIYIYATGWSPTPFTRFAEVVRVDPAWEYHEANASHDVMADQPEQLLEVLLGAA